MRPLMNEHEEGAIVISAYNPDPDFDSRLSSLEKIYERIVVVNDCSTNNFFTNNSGPSKKSNVKTVHLDKNVGTAGALNFGIKVAIDLWSPRWFLTLDQDSLIDGQYINNQIDSWKAAEITGLRVGLIGPNLLSKHLFPETSSNRLFELVDFTLQSGAMIPEETIKSIGLLDSTLFMDGLDTEYSMRATENEMKIISSTGAQLIHQISDPGILNISIMGREIRFKGRVRKYLWRAPFRSYYSTRNSILISKQYNKNLFFKFWYLKFLCLQIILGPARAKHLLAALVGVWHGLLGRRGKISQHLQSRVQYLP